jgi:hypothetical protein
VTLKACRVTVTSNGMVDSRGDVASANTIVGREGIAINVGGSVRATASNGATHPTGVLPTNNGIVQPAFTLTAKPKCASVPPVPDTCLMPCPTCGANGVQFPEQCEPGANPCSTHCDSHCRTLDCANTNPCDTDGCDPVFGCFHDALPDGTDCGQDNVCVGRETCTLGFCTAGPELDCNDGKSCTADSCDPVQGCRNNPPPACNDNNPCTIDGCSDPNTCTHDPIPDCCVNVADCAGPGGNPCAVCEDLKCGFLENCCGSPADCDDGEPCTDDLCTASTCQHVPLANGATPPGCAALCGVCDAGVCEPGLCSDDDSDPCTVPVCDPVAGCTTQHAPECCQTDPECADTDACTTDTCAVELLSCRHTLVKPGCQTCTTDTDCDPDGRCAGQACGADGICTEVAPPDCDDRRPAFSGQCVLDADGMPQCTYRCLTETACDDDNPCNGTERCSNGTCVPGSGSTCVDDDACTEDLCENATCRFAAKTGFAGVRCRFVIMAAALATAAPADLATPVRNKLTKLIGKAAGSVDAAETATGKARKKKLSAARKQLKAIGKAVRAALKKRNVSSALADVLLPAADGGVAAVEALRTA